MSGPARWTAAACLAATLGLAAHDARESVHGAFDVYKYQMKVGSETWSVSDDDAAIYRSRLELSYLGTEVALDTETRHGGDRLPVVFRMKGATSTQSHVDYEIAVSPEDVRIRDGERTYVERRPPWFVINAGYAPVSLLQAAFSEWHARGRPASLPGFPLGAVRVEPRGRDDFALNGARVTLDRYILAGFTWARLVAWARGPQLVAVLGEDAEFDRFEALDPPFAPLLPEFSRLSAAAAIDALAGTTRATTPPRDERIAIVGGTLWDGTGRPAVPDAAVVVERGRITAAGPAAAVRIPRGARVVDASGGTILPGLWDMHAHYAAAELGAAYLAAGITTVRDAGNDFDFIVPIRDAIRAGRLVGPRLLLAGYVDGVGAAGLGKVRAATPDEGRAVVRMYHGAGFEQIKIYGNAALDAATVRAIADEAHRRRMTVTGHVPRGMNALEAIDAGFDQINHIGFMGPLLRPPAPPGGAAPPMDLSGEAARRAIAAFASRGIVMDPSFARREYNVHYVAVPFERYEPGAARAPRALRELFNHTGLPTDRAARALGAMDQWGAVLLAMHRAGVPIVAGIDLVVPGYSLTRELEWYVRAGLTPAEALRTATAIPARVMRRDAELGTIERGKLGDVIVVDGNPLERIGALRDVRHVITGGRVRDPRRLWRAIGWEARP